MFSPVLPTGALHAPVPAPAPAQPHVCTRHCEFAHEFGNVFRCASSGTLHVCDANCDSTVPVDAHTAVCRLSGRAFARGDVARMRCEEEKNGGSVRARAGGALHARKRFGGVRGGRAW